jgi:hypothetical protein
MMAAVLEMQVVQLVLEMQVARTVKANLRRQP